MNTDNVQAYLNLLNLAVAIGTDLVNVIRNHAQQTLTPAEWEALEANWQDLVARTAPPPPAAPGA